MYGCLAARFNVAALVPKEGDHLLSGHPIIDTVAADNYEIVLIILNLKSGDVGDGNHYMGVPSILFELGMWVAEGPRHREPPRVHPDRPDPLNLLLLSGNSA
jgi:hypothetical protein